MAQDHDADTSRTVVQVYVPAYQREIWDEHADELDMSRSEFVKAMVQAGRRGFGGDPVGENPSGEKGPDAESSTDSDLRGRVITSLTEHDCLSWDDLLANVTGDIETRLEKTLQELQNDGKIRYSGREGGYVLDKGADE